VRVIPLSINAKQRNLRNYYKRNTGLEWKREPRKLSRCTEKTTNYEHDNILEIKRH